MPDLVQKALVTIDAASGQFLLEDVQEFSVEGPHGLTPVKTMNRLNRVRGHRGGPSEITASMTVPRELVPEADLFALWRSREVFLLSFEEVGGTGEGARFQMPGTMIDNISRSYNAEGEATLEVSLVAQDLTEIP